MKKNPALRFCNAQIGDKVYSPFFGAGEIIGVSDMLVVVEVMQKNVYNCFCTFDFYKDGRYFANLGEPCLFYLDENGNKCETRPVESIDAGYLRMNCLLSIEEFTQYKRYFAYKDVLDANHITVYANGATSDTYNAVVSYDLKVVKVSLAEDISINGIVFPAGTKVV